MAAGYGTTTQRLSTPTPPPSDSHDGGGGSNDSMKPFYTFTISFPFNIPSTSESAARRIIKNLDNLSLYYAIFVWTVLFITLVPSRKVSIVYLVATTELAILYVLLLRAFPRHSVLPHKMIDRHKVLFLLFVVCGVEMILTRAAIHFFATIAATVPVVLLHAVLSKTEGGFVALDVENLEDLVDRRVEDLV